jgi:hypothetical protein
MNEWKKTYYEEAKARMSYSPEDQLKR